MNVRSRLMLASFLMLFVELMLIRWTTSNMYYFLFLTNFILLASFLGIGIGFLRAHKVQESKCFAPLLLAVIVLLSYLCSQEYQPRINPTTGDLDYYVSSYNTSFYLNLVMLPVIFMLVVSAMASIAGMVAESFKQFPSLQAYRFEVLGTLAGISVFSVLSFLVTPPIVWGIVITSVFTALLWRTWRAGFSLLMFLQIASLILMLGVFYKETIAENHIWSTYYKIHPRQFAAQSYAVNVNGLVQQVIEPVAERLRVKTFYNKPYEYMGQNKSLENVLVIGAGTGGDVAIALAKGAKHVDAVEIDPQLYGLGKRLHPDQPYADPRVNVYINDGRAFLQQSSQQYDLIIYALTDSLMLVQGQSSVRLENYLYTLEGLQAAADHLKPDGAFAFYNYVGKDWFVDRMGNTLSLIYQQPPCINTYGAKEYWATVFVAGRDQAALQCPTHWRSSNNGYDQPATDDHPFIHLQTNSLPPLSVCMLLFIGVLSVYSVRKISGSFSTIRGHLDLFFMGAAFLLLEAKCVVSYALLFGTTWMVNSAVFIGVISSVYLAIELAARIRQMNLYVLYGLLFVSLCIIWMVPMHALLVLPVAARLVVATVISFAPIFIANLIFAQRLHLTALSTDAMGANLLGAVFGGMLEYASLLIGYQNLVLVILAIYSLAFIWLRFANAGASALSTNLAGAAARH